MKYFLLVIVSVGVLAVSCAGGPTPLPEMESAAALLYASKCGGCHSVPHPSRHKAEQWEHIMDNMEKEMHLKGFTPLTVDEKNTILGYLTRYGR
ncbi:MAG: cytochrome C [Deltaproteobacteria bacterium]|nr:cytochrome C [Deltaproteobacteria bacterium]